MPAVLTPRQIVLQSRAIHPDWTPKDHRDYLMTEEGVDRGEANRIVANVLNVSRCCGEPLNSLRVCTACNNSRRVVHSR